MISQSCSHYIMLDITQDTKYFQNIMLVGMASKISKSTHTVGSVCFSANEWFRGNIFVISSANGKRYKVGMWPCSVAEPWLAWRSATLEKLRPGLWPFVFSLTLPILKHMDQPEQAVKYTLQLYCLKEGDTFFLIISGRPNYSLHLMFLKA